jgi:uncharacterized Zn finger protein
MRPEAKDGCPHCGAKAERISEELMFGGTKQTLCNECGHEIKREGQADATQGR